MAKKSQPIVVAELPRVGLGNMLLVWARALVFAKRNELPLLTFGWQQFRIGPWLRGESRKRLYHRYFQSNHSTVQWLWYFTIQSLAGENATVAEPNENTTAHDSTRYYRFRTVPIPPNYFAGLQSERHLIRSELLAMLAPQVKSEFTQLTPPEIAVHVRRGDFVRENDPRFEPGGRCCVTPIPFFVDSISQIRQAQGKDVAVTIFSDGEPSELRPLLELGNVEMAERRSDITDLLLMSKSSFIIPSARSTFSYWAAFLSDACVIRFPYEDMTSIRGDISELFDGTIAEWNTQSAS